jgi:hypothetical protein
MSDIIQESDRDFMEYPQSTLERKLINEYLLSKGYHRQDLRNLPEQESKILMREACHYAALKLAEIEARSKFRQNIRAPE